MSIDIATTYEPLVRSPKIGPFSAVALIGSHSAVIGWDMDREADRRGLLGFAIRRSDFDPATGQMLRLDWLPGQKRFKCATDAGLDVRSNEAPFQRFHWNDYTLDASKSYLYEIFPAFGEPCDLELRKPLQLHFRPSAHVVEDLGIYFNRGVTSAHAYLDRFKGAHPDEFEDGSAYKWLSRGLKESLLDFIGRASRGDELHVAIYEFHDEDVAAALKEARTKRKVKVGIVFHAAGDKATKENKANIKAHDLEDVATPRTNMTNLSHNKFVVQVSHGQPVAVWTGSSNFSQNAFYFQTNNAMILPFPEVAKAYESYYQVLLENPKSDRAKAGVEFARTRSRPLTLPIVHRTASIAVCSSHRYAATTS